MKILRFSRNYLWGAGLAGLALAVTIGLAPSARADAPSLQLSPLQYEDTLTPGHIEQGYIDVSNPVDSAVVISSSVKGFRQTGTQGDLEFFDDPDLAAAVTVSLDTFTLGPREAVRVVFSVDSAKLAGGGVYGAIFFRTTPPTQNSGSSFVAQSANVGTLLILTNGSDTKHVGNINALHLGWAQFGGGLSGSLTYTNNDPSSHPVGFRPNLGLRALPWGRSSNVGTGLVLPGVTRQFSFSRPGSYFGVLPITVTDVDSGHHVTTWILACTGVYRLVLVMLLAICILMWLAIVGWRLWMLRSWFAESTVEPPAEPVAEPVVDPVVEFVETIIIETAAVTVIEPVIPAPKHKIKVIPKISTAKPKPKPKPQPKLKAKPKSKPKPKSKS